MAQFPAMPLWTDALIGDTFHLTPAQFGAYMRLMIVQWRSKDCKLPSDDVFLGRAIGDPKNWHRLKSVVLSFFTLGEDGFYRQMRVQDERDFAARQAVKSAAGGRAKALKTRHVRSAKSVPEECPTPAPTPTPTPTKNIVQKNSLFLEFYFAYPKRKSRKTAEKAYNRVISEGVSHETIMAGLERAKKHDNRFKDPKFTPMPASWLNAEGYADEIDENQDLKKVMFG